jgi:hypothetical protein
MAELKQALSAAEHEAKEARQEKALVQKKVIS